MPLEAAPRDEDTQGDVGSPSERRAVGWIASAGAVAVALGVFVLPYAGIDVPTRRDWWGVAFSILQGDPALHDTPRRVWSPDVWAWAALVGAPLGLAARWAVQRPRSRLEAGFLGGMGLLLGLRILSRGGPALGDGIVHVAPGLLVGVGGAAALGVAGLLALGTIHRPGRSRARPWRTGPVLVLAGATLLTASTLLPAYVWSGHAGPAEEEPAFPFVPLGEGMSAWPRWLWSAAFVVGVALLAGLGAWGGRRAGGSSAGAGLTLAAGWTALVFAVGTLAHHAPIAQTAAVGAYLGIAGAILLLVAGGVLAGGGRPSPPPGEA